MKRTILMSLLALVCVLAWSQAAQAVDPSVKCEAGKLKEAAKYAACRLKADSKSVTLDTAADYTKCEDKFMKKFPALETKAKVGICPTEGDAVVILDFINGCDGAVATALATGTLILDPVTCDVALSSCETDLDTCISAPNCGAGGVAGAWTLYLPNAQPTPDTCLLTISPNSSTTVDSAISACGYLQGASMTGTISGYVATGVQEVAPICQGYRLESTITFSSCETASGNYVCRAGAGGPIVLSGALSAVRQ